MPKGISQKTKKERGSDRDRPTGPKRTTDEVLYDRATIARMRLSGMKIAEITAEMSKIRDYALSGRTIAEDLKAVRTEWRTTSTDDYELTRLIELTRLDEEERLAIDAWNASKIKRKRKERTRTGTTDGKPFEEFVEETEEEESAGNPMFLARIESIRLRRCNILGFEAHQRSENINAAIDTLIAAGYIVRLPEEPDEESP